MSSFLLYILAANQIVVNRYFLLHFPVPVPVPVPVRTLSLNDNQYPL